jgi:hypothetical protein
MRTVELPAPSAQCRSDNRTSKGRFGKRAAGIHLTVTTRRQTPQEARRFTSAFDLLVAELVRHELRRVGRRQS